MSKQMTFKELQKALLDYTKKNGAGSQTVYGVLINKRFTKMDLFRLINWLIREFIFTREEYREELIK